MLGILESENDALETEEQTAKSTDEIISMEIEGT